MQRHCYMLLLLLLRPRSNIATIAMAVLKLGAYNICYIFLSMYRFMNAAIFKLEVHQEKAALN